MRAVRRIETDGKEQRLERLADELVRQGLNGEVSALKEIGDRLDGKPVQATEISGPDGDAIPMVNISNRDRAKAVAALVERLKRSGAQ